MLLSFLLLQAAAAPAPAPVIELNAHVRADRVTIEKHGDASLTVHADPEASKIVAVQAPKANGRKTIRNYEATVHAEAQVAAPGGPAPANPKAGETTRPD